MVRAQAGAALAIHLHLDRVADAESPRDHAARMDEEIAQLALRVHHLKAPAGGGLEPAGVADLPARLPKQGRLIDDEVRLQDNLGGGSALGIASTMNIAGHLVDVSPLSTIGALCIASVPAGDMSRKLFNQLLAWGMSMTVVGAVLCWLLFA